MRRAIHIFLLLWTCVHVHANEIDVCVILKGLSERHGRAFLLGPRDEREHRRTFSFFIRPGFTYIGIDGKKGSLLLRETSQSEGYEVGPSAIVSELRDHFLGPEQAIFCDACLSTKGHTEDPRLATPSLIALAQSSQVTVYGVAGVIHYEQRADVLYVWVTKSGQPQKLLSENQAFKKVRPGSNEIEPAVLSEFVAPEIEAGRLIYGRPME